MNIYARLTPAEQQYLAQDGVYEQDVNEETDDIWDLIDYLTPMYGRGSDGWCDMVVRLTMELDGDWHMPSFLVNVEHKIKI